MSKFSSTGTSFHINPSTLTRTDQQLRELVQDEVFLIMDEIKLEIETKIKSIDRNIIELRSEIKRLQLVQKDREIAELVEKMEKIQAEMQVLKYHQFSMKNSRSKSLDKERKPIFKKDMETYDFSSVILGLEGEDHKSEKRIFAERKETANKPPLPREPTRMKSQASLKSVGERENRPQRNPVLDSSSASSVHRWLVENNQRESSCFSSIIREEDIEESVFY